MARLARTKKLTLKLSFWPSGVITVTGRASAASVAKEALWRPKFASAPEAVGMIPLSRVEGSSSVAPAPRPLVGSCWGNTVAADTANGGANLAFTISWPGNRLVTVCEAGVGAIWAWTETAAQIKKAMRNLFFMSMGRGT